MNRETLLECYFLFCHPFITSVQCQSLLRRKLQSTLFITGTNKVLINSLVPVVQLSQRNLRTILISLLQGPHIQVLGIWS